MEQRAIVIVAGVGLIAALLYVYWKQPHDYDDCILKTMTGVTSREAARAIETSCRAKFPPIAAQDSTGGEWEDVPLVSLTPEEVEKLTGRAEVLFKYSPRLRPTSVMGGNEGKPAQPSEYRLSDDQYTGSLYNGNDKLTVGSVEFAVTITDRSPGSKVPPWERGASTRSYVVPMTISPKSVKNFRFNIIAGDPSARYSWQVVSAKGYKSED